MDDPHPRVWDLLSAAEVGRLYGHRGSVKCIQVEDHICLTGGEDGDVRLWDLRRIDEDDEWGGAGEMVAVLEEEEDSNENTEAGPAPNGIRSSEGPCVRLFEGHSKSVTALYFEDECLASNMTVVLYHC